MWLYWCIYTWEGYYSNWWSGDDDAAERPDKKEKGELYIKMVSHLITA